MHDSRVSPPPLPPPSTPVGCDVRERLTRMELAVHGLDGTNGLRSQVRAHSERITALEAINTRQAAETAALRRWSKWGLVLLLFGFGIIAPRPITEHLIDMIKLIKPI